MTAVSAAPEESPWPALGMIYPAMAGILCTSYSTVKLFASAVRSLPSQFLCVASSKTVSLHMHASYRRLEDMVRQPVKTIGVDLSSSFFRCGRTFLTWATHPKVRRKCTTGRARLRMESCPARSSSVHA